MLGVKENCDLKSPEKGAFLVGQSGKKPSDCTGGTIVPLLIQIIDFYSLFYPLGGTISLLNPLF